jgi:hypothetical protein
MGVLDFRAINEVCNLHVPGSALALHGCPTSRCGFTKPENWAITWLGDGDEIEIIGDPQRAVELGTAWDSVDFPTVAYHGESLTDDRFFTMEGSIFQNFTCYGPKIGGHVFWIQGDQTPVDRNGKPMTFIGQCFGTSEVEIGDGGIAYIFFSSTTNQTEVITQSY